MAFKPITVSQLNTYIKQIFEAEELLHGIGVVGEVSGWSVVRGTAYFTLKDASSALSCVCFCADKFSDIKNGDSVIVIGSATYYSKSGKLNFNVVKIEPYGENLIFQEFLKLKQKLEALGYFAEEHKIALPTNIKRIGVVSSEGGAVIQDIINVRTRRNPTIDIVLYPVKVQGINSENEIAQGIEFLDNYNVDVIVVARGGGSFEELQPFNTEIVANATYNCKKPIVSAVGHETDFTIIDFCSDLRAPTPSAAAELLCEDLQVRNNKVKEFSKQLIQSYNRLSRYKKDLLDLNISNMEKRYSYIMQSSENVLSDRIGRLLNLSNFMIERANQRYIKNASILKKLNPNEVLKLGYAAIKSGNNYINSLHELRVDDVVEIKFINGKADALIKSVEEDN